MYLDGSRKQIINWVQKGLNDREIGDRLRVSRSTVRYWRHRNGVLRPHETASTITPKKQRAPKDKSSTGGGDAAKD